MASETVPYRFRRLVYSAPGRGLRMPLLEVDGARVPSAFPIDYEGQGGRCDVELTVAYDGSRWVAEDVHLVGTATPDDLRALAQHLDTLVTEAVVQWTHQPALVTGYSDEQGHSQPWLPPEAHESHHKAHRARQRRRWITDELLAQVAEVYRANEGRPTAAVADHFQVARATASRWVAEARKREVLS